MTEQSSSQFASPDRSPISDVYASFYQFREYEDKNKVLDAIPDIVLVLDENRQIIFANKAVEKINGVPSIHSILGIRPGELLNCVHSDENVAGCGTTIFCSTCGAVNAILESQEGFPAEQECRILQKNGGALDLKVFAVPLTISGRLFTVITIVDISTEKRKKAFERIFFHDILNIAMGLQGFSDLLNDATEQELPEISQTLNELSNRLIDELKMQREISSAESGELVLNITNFPSGVLLNKLQMVYSKHPANNGSKIIIDKNSEDVSIVSDERILFRVLGNMVKNALEAEKGNSLIELNCKTESGFVIFSVSNPQYMPLNVQLQMFQRSFSTKGEGRGLGTYSMKLLGEKYLKGKVYFSSVPGDGTKFFIKIPQII